eukprot:365325-Chlamydomonas_euryale.AAC.44
MNVQGTRLAMSQSQHVQHAMDSKQTATLLFVSMENKPYTAAVLQTMVLVYKVMRLLPSKNQPPLDVE